MNFTQSLNRLFSELVGEGRRFKTNADLARFCEVDPSYTHRLLKGIGGKKHLEAFAEILDRLGVRILSLEEEKTREVCFVDATIVRSGSRLPPPDAEPYIAVPLTSEAGAGPGFLPEEDFKSWVLVHRGMPSIARRSNLIAVEIAKNARSMMPLLHPGDIVLVDLDDWGQDSRYGPPGNIFLVREPGQEGGGKVKRVSVNGKGGNSVIIYYSENTEENEPEPYFINQDFDGDIRKAVVGKVVWAWTDLSRK